VTERNSKVRRRIAAGKLRLRVRDLRNLGPRAETLLAEIGIHSVEALRERGGLEAYLELRRRDVVKSLNMLWALVGALDPWPEGTDWRDVARSKARLALMLEVEARDQARAAVQQAAKVAVTPSSEAEEPIEWVPGLPFESANLKKKNRR
jgi:DNA transformation protein and related proteins